MTLLELFGYFGSVLVAISLMMSNIKRLRWINLIGAAVFSIYGFMIDAIPVFALNGWIALVDIYYLVRIYQFKDDFDMVQLSSVRTPLFNLLMTHYQDDMLKYYPNMSLDELDNAVPLLIFRNMKPVGLFAYRRDPDEAATVEALIDYVIPEARDFKTAQFLFSRHSTELRKEAINTVISNSPRVEHQAYLKKIGFVEKEGHFVLDLR